MYLNGFNVVPLVYLYNTKIFLNKSIPYLNIFVHLWYYYGTKVINLGGYKIMDKNEISTRLRLPYDLHQKLKILSDVDKRSLHSFMVYILEQHVIEYERMILDKYGFDGFDEVHDALFGKLRSHLFINELDFEMQAKLERMRQIKKDFTDEFKD
jgi:hypothetical protein